jgi:hypothetical protein
MKNLFTQEPVRFVGAIQATLAVAVLFGVALTAEQIAGVVLAIAAWLSFVTRQQVTPAPTPVDPERGASDAITLLVVVVIIVVLLRVLHLI